MFAKIRNYFGQLVALQIYGYGGIIKAPTEYRTNVRLPKGDIDMKNNNSGVNRQANGPVREDNIKEYKDLLLNLVWESKDEYFLKSLYTYAKCLRQAIKK